MITKSNRLATRNDVAKYANVAPSTVSHVINNTKFVSDEIKSRVYDAIKELHYEPNLVAKSLRTTQTKQIVIFISNLSNTYYADICYGVIKEARKYDYLVTICVVESNKVDYYNEMYLRQVDGIINFSYTFCKPEVFEKLAKRVAMINCRPYDEFSIGINYADAMENIVKKFAEKNRREIAFITGRDWKSVEKDTRYIALDYYTKQYGIELKKENILNSDETTEAAKGTSLFSEGAAGMEKMLKKNPDIDAVFCMNDMLAIGAFKYLNSIGKRVPEDISLCGCDNISYLPCLDNKLSTIDFSKMEFGRLCTQNILDKINGRKAEGTKTIYASFIDNGSI